MNQGSGRRVWRRIALADDGSGAELADPFSAGFAAPDHVQVGYAFGYPRDGRFVAVWRDDGTFLARTETGLPLTFAGLTSSSYGRDGYLPFESPGGSGVDVSPSGRRLALTSPGAQTMILELDPRLNDPQFDQRAPTLGPGQPRGGFLYSLAISNDGSVLAIGTNEGRVLLFETEGTTQQLEWRAHEKYVYCLAWTPDGTRLVTASGDATLKIWDTRTRVKSLIEEDRWQTRGKDMAACEDLDEVCKQMAGEEREAARVERIRLAQAK